MKFRILIITFFALLGAACSQSRQEAMPGGALKLTEQQWKEKLTPQQYYVLRGKGTDRPFTGELLSNEDKGIYSCAGCGQELFTDAMKFDSHTGWPSFDREIPGGNILQTTETGFGVSATEISCSGCGGHLGHIFDDGPTATGQRYCVNSSSLSFGPGEQ